MSTLKYLPNYTVKDYNLWDGDWELIDGIPYAMSPPPVRKHRQLGSALVTQLVNALNEQKEQCGNCNVFYELDWIVQDNTVLRPDVVVTLDEATDFITAPPVLIVEILSPSTALKDKHVKFDIYQEKGVKYYIVVDPETMERQINVLINGEYRQENELTTFETRGNCSIELNLDEALMELD